MKTIAIIQARLQSTRLPAKVLLDIGGKTMLQRVVDRTSQAERIDNVVIATSDEFADRLLVDYCRDQGWDCVAGSEHDVLSRYVKAATEFEADRVVRITSDCPLIDPSVIDQVIDVADEEQADYACNFYPQRRYPRGLDCEVLTRQTLGAIDRHAVEARFREHVTLAIYDQAAAKGTARLTASRTAFDGQSEQQLGDLNLGSLAATQDWSHLRWTIDTPDDLRLIRMIYQHFGDREFGWQDVLEAYVVRPEWFDVNQGSIQKVA